MKGYTAKVGLRKAKPRLSIGLLQVLSDEQAEQIRQHGHLLMPRLPYIHDDSALEALADRMEAKRRAEYGTNLCRHCICTHGRQ